MQLKRARDHVERIVTSISELEQLIQDARTEVAVATRQTAEISAPRFTGDSSRVEARTQLLPAGRIRIVGALAASIVHELRQPIAATLANVAAARRFLRQPEPNVGEALAALENIHRDEQRAAQLVERFRCLLKEPSPSSDCCDLNETIRAVVDLVRGEATQRAIDLRCDLAFGLPPIAADAGQLEQLLLNLVLNAFDAVGDPEWISRAVTIRTRYDNGGKLTLVMVEDAGPPVPDEVIERMTTPLYTTKPDGLGLGLAICREILAAHGSELLIARGDSGGMVFSFKLRTVVDGREAEIAVRQQPSKSPLRAD